ncbi:MAG: 50S ribosomal protein L6 [Planctomycetota bacterium]|jgi:large subunit ribosomal protein L6
MSRIGKKAIAVPSGVKVEQKGQDNQIVVSNSDEANSRKRALHGTARALLNNVVVGVTQGFSKPMQIFGTGYNIKEQGGKVVLNVGFCHPVELKVPKSVTVEIKTPATRGNDVPALFTLSGPNKQELGQFAAEVRKVRPPEPYQGKGIRYADEHVIRKVGKALGA